MTTVVRADDIERFSVIMARSESTPENTMITRTEWPTLKIPLIAYLIENNKKAFLEKMPDLKHHVAVYEYDVMVGIWSLQELVAQNGKVAIVDLIYKNYPNFFADIADISAYAVRAICHRKRAFVSWMLTRLKEENRDITGSYDLLFLFKMAFWDDKLDIMCFHGLYTPKILYDIRDIYFESELIENYTKERCVIENILRKELTLEQLCYLKTVQHDIELDVSGYIRERNEHWIENTVNYHPYVRECRKTFFIRRRRRDGQNKNK